MASNVNPLTGSITDDLNNAWSYTVLNCTRFVAGALGWIPAGLGNAFPHQQIPDPAADRLLGLINVCTHR